MSKLLKIKYSKMIVQKIQKQTANKIISNKHYSKRLGIFWEGFALLINDKITGIVCYGQPSAPIQKHAFKDRDFRLYELTRLVVDRDIKNGASYLISHSLKMLSSQPASIISFSDLAHGHSGIVYQATNWTYTGSTVSHDCLYKVNEELIHPMTLRDKLGIKDPKRWAKENNIEIIKPKPKHRYFYFVGNKKQKKEMISKLNYKIIQPYPKSDKITYDDGLNCSNYV